MADFEKAFQRTLLLEGGYSDNPNDAGGRTKYGITEKEAFAFGYVGDIKELPIDTAKLIYKINYWNKLKATDIEHQIIGEVIFDTAVNMGIKTAVKMAQRTLNNVFGFNLQVDGIIGEKTLRAINSIPASSVNDFVIDYTARRLTRYRYLIIRRPANENFRSGWNNRAISFVKEL